MIHRRARRTPLSLQRGSFLLEGLFAILIFSIGILGLLGLQMTAVKQSADAKYRSEASLFANELIGTMWASDRTPATLQTAFQTNGAQYAAWSARVAAVLPGVSASANQPQVSIDLAGNVQVNMLWQAPGESAPHSHVIVAQIR